MTFLINNPARNPVNQIRCSCLRKSCDEIIFETELSTTFWPFQVEEAVDEDVFDDIPEALENDDADHVTINFPKKDTPTSDTDPMEKIPLTKMNNAA